MLMEEKNKYILYIDDNINDLKLSYKKEILQMIIYSNINDDKIETKPNGTLIRFSDINNNLLKNIYTYIFNKIENSEIIF